MKKTEISTAARLAKKFLEGKGIQISHSDALEMLSQSLGEKNFQTLLPKLDVETKSDMQQQAQPPLGLIQRGLEHEFEMSQQHSRVWIKVDNMNLTLIRTDEGLVVDVYAYGSDEDPVGSTWVSTAECVEELVDWFEREGYTTDYELIVSLCKEVGISVQEDNDQPGRWVYVCEQANGIYAEGSDVSFDSEHEAWASAFENQYESQRNEYVVKN